MPRIDFYSNIDNPIVYTCRLARKVRAAKSSLVIFSDDRQLLLQLDKTLWTFSELDFLPHVMSSHPLAAQTPIVLTDNDALDLPHHQILINLSRVVPQCLAQFERVLEIISLDETDKSAGRERYRFYQQQGYSLTHFLADRT